jgi:ubiquinone biosynthesis protein COQ4
MQWGRALRALRRFARRDYDGLAIQEFAVALDGGDQERAFREFCAEPASARLLGERPDLPALLDDHERLAAMPADSLGRAFLEVARRDGISVRALSESARRLPDYDELLPDSERRWFADRGIAVHDLLHVLTGYDRDEPGEALLVAFSVPRYPVRVLKVALALSLLIIPKRSWLPFVLDMRRAWRRGRAALARDSVAWEELLALPVEEARRRLAIAPTAEAHPHGLWRLRPHGRGWMREPVPLPG